VNKAKYQRRMRGAADTWPNLCEHPEVSVSDKTYGVWRCLLWLLLIGQASCYRASFYTDPKLVRGLEHDRWTDFFVFGLVGTEQIDVRSFCEGKPIAEVKTGGNFATSLVSALTIGIYTPRKMYVTCAAGPGQSRFGSSRKLQLDLDSAGQPVRAVVSTEGGRTQVAQVTPVGPETYRIRYAAGGAR
jgi:hypothetical protein